MGWLDRFGLAAAHRGLSIAKQQNGHAMSLHWNDEPASEFSVRQA